jgi:hypothetical protein
VRDRDEHGRFKLPPEKVQQPDEWPGREPWMGEGLSGDDLKREMYRAVVNRISPDEPEYAEHAARLTELEHQTRGPNSHLGERPA